MICADTGVSRQVRGHIDSHKTHVACRDHREFACIRMMRWYSVLLAPARFQSPMIFMLISRRKQLQNYRLNLATILLLPLQKMLLRSQDFTISQDRQRTANLLLSLHALASS